MRLFGQTLAILAFSLMLFLGPNETRTKAQTQYCDLALVLALDASSSVDTREYALQMKGLAAALLNPEVKEAILSMGGLEMAAFEWNGKSNQKLIFNWTTLLTESDIINLASKLAFHQRNSTNSPTAIGAALGYGYRLLQKNPKRCTRNVIDVSGDGANNEGITPLDVYQFYDFGNIVVNGLVIKDLYENPESFYRDAEIYYRQHVIRGPAAFLVLAHGFNDFEIAMKRKLLKEIVPGPIGRLN